jgi:hypothetical protein
MPVQELREGSGVAPTHSQPGAKWRWVVSTALRPLNLRKRPHNLYIVGLWVSGPFWTGTENLFTTGIRSTIPRGLDRGFEPDRNRRIFRAKKSTACLPLEWK